MLNLTTTLKELDGKDVMENDKPITMKDAILKALFIDSDEFGNPVKPDDKIKRYELVLKIYANDVVEFTPGELTYLGRVVLIYPTMVAGPVRKFLESANA